ncbi:hypothetical protein, partial [uncultured Duncaniella sp.]
ACFMQSATRTRGQTLQSKKKSYPSKTKRDTKEHNKQKRQKCNSGTIRFSVELSKKITEFNPFVSSAPLSFCALFNIDESNAP